MKVVWTNLATKSFEEELNFIATKWSFKEVNNFIDLVDEFIKNLENGILLGKISVKTNIYSFVLSKQTSVFFDYHEETAIIEVLLFWNNQKNPTTLKKLL